MRCTRRASHSAYDRQMRTSDPQRDVTLAPWQELDATDAYLLDVRAPVEFRRDSIDGTVYIPLGQLRGKMSELPRDREIS